MKCTGRGSLRLPEGSLSHPQGHPWGPQKTPRDLQWPPGPPHGPLTLSQGQPQGSLAQPQEVNRAGCGCLGLPRANHGPAAGMIVGPFGGCCALSFDPRKKILLVGGIFLYSVPVQFEHRKMPPTPTRETQTGTCMCPGLSFSGMGRGHFSVGNSARCH